MLTFKTRACAAGLRRKISRLVIHFASESMRAIRLHEKLLLILSGHSVQSDWVREEVEMCLEREQREKRLVLFPVRLDNTLMETAQRGRPRSAVNVKSATSEGGRITTRIRRFLIGF
jgi:hypothetical protein